MKIIYWSGTENTEAMAEKISRFYEVINSMNGKEYINTYLFYKTTLVTAKVKPAITLTLCKLNNKNVYKLWNIYGVDFLKKLNLEYVELRETEKALIILIYDKKLLEASLMEKSVLEFLHSLGYCKNSTVESSIQTLIERYKIYQCPHELGVFLGFPINDVKDFINCSEKKCILCGYWKVYNEEEQAKRTFDLYDKIKQYTAHKILEVKKENLHDFSLERCFEFNQVTS